MDIVSENHDEFVIVEGKAKILKKKTVFYNKVQQFNRDLR